LKGALGRIERVYGGEPSIGPSEAPRDLAVAEAMVENLERERAVLTGLDGWVTIAVGPAGGPAARVRLRLDGDGLDGEAGARPLVLFVPGAPAYAARWARPTSPRALTPGWLADILERAGFDAAGGFQLAVVDSPGEVPGFADVVAGVVTELGELLPLDGRTVLVGEREGAQVVIGAALAMASPPAGLVLVAGGALDPERAAALAAVPLLAVPALGHPANPNLDRAVSLLRDAGGAARQLPADAMPWQIALPLTLPALGAFLGDVLR
jgi:hypothetical protein